MKKLITIALLASGAFAANFSKMSTEEMMNMRGSVPVANRSAFQQEMQKRMQSMTPQERQKYKGNCAPSNCPDKCKGKGLRTENKVVYDLRTGEAKNINSKLQSLKAVANHYIDKKSDYKIAVVIGGDAYKFFVDDLQYSPYDKDAELKALKPKIEPKIRELAEVYDVNFTMCDVGIEYRAIPEDSLYDFVEAKKTRSIYLIEFQNDGYAYIPIH